MRALHPTEDRVLVFAPTGRDATLAVGVLEREGFQGVVAASAEALCAQIEAGAGAVLLAEEALSPDALSHLSAALQRQPPWSDLPFILFAVPIDTGSSAARHKKMVDALGNITILDRPLRVATLFSAVRAALRARRRQYAARENLRDLEHQEAALKQADQRKDEFLAMLAHELRNPMAALSMALSLLERTPNDETKSARYRETARRQMRSLVRLVDDLLDVARITRGTVELRKAPVDLPQLLQASVAAARPLLEARQHSLSLEIASGTFVVDADGTRLEQVIANLLSNAAKYTEHGGRVTLRLGREERARRGYATLEVSDTGRGIPASMLPKVFDLFVQVDQSLDRSLGGLGLGLTLVKRLTEMHGGTVEAHSEGANQGSTFRIRLPLLDARLVAAPGAGGNTVDALDSRRVVLVEDSEDARETMREFLEELGHEVVVAEDGVDGAQSLIEQRPDVGLVDIGLPHIDGYEVARRVRAHPAGADIFLIALTGYGGAPAVAKALQAGFDHHLTKPVNIHELPQLLLRRRS